MSLWLIESCCCFPFVYKCLGLPDFLYGSQLEKLKQNDLVELETVQNITLRIMQGLLFRTLASAARRLLGFISIEAEIDKRKLYFLGRIINMRPGIICRWVFLIRLIRWKWNYRKKFVLSYKFFLLIWLYTRYCQCVDEARNFRLSNGIYFKKQFPMKK